MFVDRTVDSAVSALSSAVSRHPLLPSIRRGHVPIRRDAHGFEQACSSRSKSGQNCPSQHARSVQIPLESKTLTDFRAHLRMHSEKSAISLSLKMRHIQPRLTRDQHQVGNSGPNHASLRITVWRFCGSSASGYRWLTARLDPFAESGNLLIQLPPAPRPMYGRL